MLKGSKASKPASPKVGEAPVCTICLETPKNVGSISCGHSFCFDCILKWSETENTCPNCKTRFSSISRADGDTKDKSKKRGAPSSGRGGSSKKAKTVKVNRRSQSSSHLPPWITSGHPMAHPLAILQELFLPHPFDLSFDMEIGGNLDGEGAGSSSTSAGSSSISGSGSGRTASSSSMHGTSVILGPMTRGMLTPGGLISLAQRVRATGQRSGSRSSPSAPIMVTGAGSSTDPLVLLDDDDVEEQAPIPRGSSHRGGSHTSQRQIHRHSRHPGGASHGTARGNSSSSSSSGDASRGERSLADTYRGVLFLESSLAPVRRPEQFTAGRMHRARTSPRSEGATPRSEGAPRNRDRSSRSRAGQATPSRGATTTSTTSSTSSSTSSSGRTDTGGRMRIAPRLTPHSHGFSITGSMPFSSASSLLGPNGFMDVATIIGVVERGQEFMARGDEVRSRSERIRLRAARSREAASARMRDRDGAQRSREREREREREGGLEAADAAPKLRTSTRASTRDGAEPPRTRLQHERVAGRDMSARARDRDSAGAGAGAGARWVQRPTWGQEKKEKES